MRRILYVANAGYIHTQRFAEHYRDRGIEVHVATFHPGRIEGVTVHQLANPRLGRVGYLLAAPALRGLANRLQPDVVHAHYVTSYGFVAALAGLHPLVVTAWGTDVLVSPRESALLRLFAGYAVRHADAVTTVAEHMNAAVMELGVPAGRVVAVPFGVDADRFRLGQQAPPGAGPLRLICTRNFDALYDIPTLIDAVHEVVASGVEFEVDLVGRGPLREDIERQVAQCGLASRVTFHGHVDHARLATLLGRAHVFVTPAVSDGNNVSLNEAMACGCFPIATAIPANTQWIEDGVNGFLYAPRDSSALADRIRRAMADGELRARMRAGNRAIVEQRASWRACVQRMDEIYADAMWRCGGR